MSLVTQTLWGKHLLCINSKQKGQWALLRTGSSLWLVRTNADASPSLPWRWQPCWSAPISASLVANLPEIDLVRELGQHCKSLHEGTVYPPCHPWTRKRRKEVQFQIERSHQQQCLMGRRGHKAIWRILDVSKGKSGYYLPDNTASSA